jgi:hypothetical protein
LQILGAEFSLGYDEDVSHPYLEPSTEARLHRQAFELCVKDLDKALEFVEGHDQNLNVFSHRFYELLLRSCTEFESRAKTLLSAHGINLKENATIRDYFPLADMYRLADCHVFATRWNPAPLRISPFADWTSPTEGPSWYRAYNGVKHSRQANFGNASLRNVLSAVSAVMIILVQAYRPYFLGSASSSTDVHGVESLGFTDFPFMIQRARPQ